MDQNEKRKKVALFRYGVIAQLAGLRKTERGERNRLLQELTERQWEIPFSQRTSIGRSTILSWISQFEESGREFSSLEPKSRYDQGKSRVISEETELALATLRKDHSGIGAKAFLKIAKRRQIINENDFISKATLYRIFKRHTDLITAPAEEFRRFESEFSNDLWQSDCWHGPRILTGGKLQKVFLFAIIDDHSRMVVHAEFYLRENLESFLDCLKKALGKRGIPRKLYTDNGACFRAIRLKEATARLDIALIYAKPYRPQGKGKIERWFRTVTTGFIPFVKKETSLDQLNKLLQDWIDRDYHTSKHGSTGEAPLDRFVRHINQIRKAPSDLAEYFRIRVRRKVAKDRTVCLNGKLFEAPFELVGKRVLLLFHPESPHKVEITFREKSYGFISILDPVLNGKLVKSSHLVSIVSEDSTDLQNETPDEKEFRSGSLFGRNLNELD